jgi:hypothetical protein
VAAVEKPAPFRRWSLVSTRLDRNTPACVRVARRRDSLLGLFQRYRPKNNHNRMITGIGTPNSQSRIPRPIVSSSILTREGNTGQKLRFHFGESHMSRRVIFCSLPYGLEGSLLGGRSNQIGTELSGVRRFAIILVDGPREALFRAKLRYHIT